MATLVVRFTWDSDTQDWSLNNTSLNTFQRDSANGYSGNGSIQGVKTGRNTSGYGTAAWTGTWEDLASYTATPNILDGATVTAIQCTEVRTYAGLTSWTKMTSCAWLAQIYGSGWTAVDLFSRSVGTSADSSWVSGSGSSRTVPAGLQPSTSTINLTFRTTLVTDNTTPPQQTGSGHEDYFTLTITYTAGAPPTPVTDTANGAAYLIFKPTDTADGAAALQKAYSDTADGSAHLSAGSTPVTDTADGAAVLTHGVTRSGLVAEYVAGLAKAPASGTFGNLGTGSFIEQTYPNGVETTKFTLAEDAVVSKLTYRLTNDTAQAWNFKGVIYADDSGPAALMGVTPGVSVAVGSDQNVDATFTTPVALPAGTYWLGMVVESWNGFKWRYDWPYTDEEASFAGSYASVPDPAGTETLSTKRWCVYATYVSLPSPGNNTDPTDEWADLVGDNDGTLNNFAYINDTFGYTTAGAEVSDFDGDYSEVSKAVLATAGYATKLTIYLRNQATGHAACAAKAVIYADNGGVPNGGALVALSNEVSITDSQAAGWVTFTFPAPVYLAATTYWVGLHVNTAAGGLEFFYTTFAGEYGVYWNPDTYSDGTETTFASTGGGAGPRISAYVTLASSTSGWGGTGAVEDPYALVLAGTDDAVDCGDRSAGEDKTVSYEAWFATVSGGTNQELVGDHRLDGGSRSNTVLKVNGGKLQGQQSDESYNTATVEDTASCDDGGWHHGVLTIDGSYLRLYLDGELVDGPEAVTAGTVTQGDSSIGAKANGGGTWTDFFIGAIATVRVYGRALTADEVLDNYTAGIAGRSRIKSVTGSAALAASHTDTADGAAALQAARSDTADGSAHLSAAAGAKTDTADGSAALQKAATDTADGSAALRKTATDTADGAAALRQAKTDAADGSAALRQAKADTATGSAALQQAKTDTATGAAALRAAKTDTADGAALLVAERTDTADGAGALQRAKTDVATGAAHLVSLEGRTDTADGSAALRQAKTDTADGSGALAAERTGTADGAAVLYSAKTDTADGAAALVAERADTADGAAVLLAERTDTATGAAVLVSERTDTADGAAHLQAARTDTANGSAHLVTLGQYLDTADGSAALRGAKTDVATGAAALQKTASDTATGAAVLTNSQSDTADGSAALLAERTDTATGAAHLVAIQGNWDTADGSAALQGAKTDTADGAAALEQAKTDAATGAAVLIAERVDTADGAAALRGAKTDEATGAGALQDSYTATADGSADLTFWASNEAQATGAAYIIAWDMVVTSVGAPESAWRASILNPDDGPTPLGGWRADEPQGGWTVSKPR